MNVCDNIDSTIQIAARVALKGSSAFRLTRRDITRRGANQ